MRPEERDAAYLWDMLDAAHLIEGFTTGVRFEQYMDDRKLQLAVERALEIIGEAARRVSEDSGIAIRRSPGVRSSPRETCWHTNMARSSKTGYGGLSFLTSRS